MRRSMEKSVIPTKGAIVSAMFLVAGTCVGGGMLALPVATGISGFVPSLVTMFFCWLAMTLSALMLLEVSLWMEEGVHLITMASRILGTPGKVVSWLLYLFICYASIVAYTAGGGLVISTVINNFFDIVLSKELASIGFLLVFGSIIYLGSSIVGRVNAILFTSMIIAYFGLVIMGIDEIKIYLLNTRKWSGSIMAIPLLLTSFSFQTMVPSLTPYLKKHSKSLRWAIVGGTGIAFLMYAVWQCLMLGIVPVEGESGLIEALKKGVPATQFLGEHVQGKWITSIAEFFGFFAIATSFLGIALGLFDFLSDGLHIEKKGYGKLALGLLIVIPTLIFATQFERIFLLALDTTGGFGDSILNGIIPALMVWVGRYYLGYKSSFQVWGGKPLLILVICFFIGTLTIEIMAQTGSIRSIYDIYDILE
jgi:tyrosine-specific transport protein